MVAEWTDSRKKYTFHIHFVLEGERQEGAKHRNKRRKPATTLYTKLPAKTREKGKDEGKRRKAKEAK